MATIKAFIRTSTKDKDFVNVRFRLTDGRSVQLFHKSDIKVNPNDFDAKAEKIKAKIVFSAKARNEFDKSITDRKNLISELYLNATDKSTLTSDWLEDAIDRKLHPEKYIEVNQSEPYLIAYIDNFIQHAPERTKKRENTYVSKSTIKSYVANRNRIKSYLNYKKKKDVLLSEVDSKFCEDYVRYLTDKKRIVKTKKGEVVNEVKQYAKNTIGDAVKALKTMLADAPVTVNIKDLYVFKEDSDSVYLNEAELTQLKAHDFAAVPHLDRVRDWFLLLAWTGSRYSDLEKIDKANIRNGMITYRQQKTNTSVTIPMHPVVSEVLQKYDFNMPEIISNQKFNDYIKDACKLAGIDTLESFTRTVGGKLITETLPKYELVQSHTCRRSFCTNMYLRGLDTMMIRSISGHKTEPSFLKYIKVSQQQHAEMMAKKWSEIYK
jgi:site-specific recombinase XerD